ncbi:MAG: hypothetical protein GWP19_03915 [Planctomycetia bacterium]|nr:hypothetical protein [Planctomycetia bacterium]
MSDNKIQLIDLREKFFRVSNNIFDMNLDVYEIAVYSVLCRYANNDSKMAFPSLSTLCKLLKISRPKLIKTIKSLNEKHIIYKLAGNQKTSNKYYLLSISSNADELVNDIYQPSKPRLPASKPRLPGVVNEVYSIKTNTIKTNKENLIINTVYPDNLNTKLFIDKYEEWIKYRKEIKHKMVTSTINKQLKMLAKYDVNKTIAMIDQSIENGWTGLFDIQQNTNGLSFAEKQAITQYNKYRNKNE